MREWVSALVPLVDGFFYRENGSCCRGWRYCLRGSCLSAGLACHVYLIVRKPYLRASKIMQERVMKHDKIEVLFGSLMP